MPGETHPTLPARRCSYSKGNPLCKQACKFAQNFSLLAQSAQYVAKPGGVHSWCLCTTSNLTCPLHAFAIRRIYFFNVLCRPFATKDIKEINPSNSKCV